MKGKRLLSIGLVLVLLALVPGGAPPTAAQLQPGFLVAPALSQAEGPAPVPDRAQVAQALRSSPVMFIENVGQFAEGARFQVWGGTGTMWLAEDAIWITVLEKPSSPQPPSPTSPPKLALSKAEGLGGTEGGRRGVGGEGQPCKGVNLRLTFPGANPHPRIEPFDRLDTVVSYFIGNDPDQWHPDVPVWGGVRYVDLYPGVDLELTGEEGRWSWRLVTHSLLEGSHVEPDNVQRNIRLRIEGADDVTLGGHRLRLTTPLGDFTLPVADCAFQVDGITTDDRLITFDVRSPKAPEVAVGGHPSAVGATGAIDLVYSTFLGGSDDEPGNDIAVDASGQAYVIGRTWFSNFPTTPGAFDMTFNDEDSDAFVLKLNTAGSALVYSTFLGGHDADTGKRIAVDASGQAYVTGNTRSYDFPITASAFDTTVSSIDTFVTKLNATGSALIYSTLLGGSRTEYVGNIAVDSSGEAYVTGTTSSTDFPTTPGAFDTTYDGARDAFVTKLNGTGSALVYSTFLGGYKEDQGYGIAVDISGQTYVTGRTESTSFPTTTGAFDTTYNGSDDAFVTKLNAAGSSLVYSTFLGGSDSDGGGDIAVDVDANREAYVTGYTRSDDFPTTAGAFDTTRSGTDAFVTKLNAGGSDLIYSTFLGGSDTECDLGCAIAVDGSGAAYTTGETGSSDFPTTAGAFDTTHNGRGDVFVTKLNATGSALLYSTFLGGSRWDQGNDIAVDASGQAHVTGETSSSDFPTTPGAFDMTYNGGTYFGSDAFVTKLTLVGRVYLPLIVRNR